MPGIEIYTTDDISLDMFPNFTAKMADKLNHDAFCRKRKGHFEAGKFFTAEGLSNRYNQFTDPNHADAGYVIMANLAKGSFSATGIGSVITRKVFEKTSLTTRTKSEIGKLTIVSAFVHGDVQDTVGAYLGLLERTADVQSVAIIEPASTPPEFIHELTSVTDREPVQMSLVVGNQIRPTQSFIYLLDKDV